MDLVSFGRTDLRVSPLGLGAMNFGVPGWGCDQSTAQEILHTYRDAGGNFLDTANIYGGGQSEVILGKLLGVDRKDVVLASKVGFPSPRGGPSGLSPTNIRKSLEASLQRLGTDYLDLYQLHAFDPNVRLEDTLGVLHDLIDEGLIRHAGSSNFFAWQIAHADAVAQSVARPSLVSMQMMYNLVRRDIEREHIGYATRVNQAIIAYGPLHGGHLAAAWRSRHDIPPDSRAAGNPDVYLNDEERLFSVTAALASHATSISATPGQVALAWVLRNPAITVTLSAARSARELAEQTAAFDLDADQAFWTSLDHSTALPPSYPADFYRRIQQRDRGGTI